MSDTLKRLLRGPGYFVLLVLWLLVMSLPCFAFALAARGELGWRRGEHTSDRLWLIQERDQKGLGYQAERRIQNGAAGAVCVRNTVSFLLWEGSAQEENAAYCECYAADGTASGMECP